MKTNKNNVYGYAAVREDGRVKDFYFGKPTNSTAWVNKMLGITDNKVKIVFASPTGCGIAAAADEHLPINSEFPPHRGTIILMSSVKEIQAMRNSIGGDAEYYDKLDALAARGVPVYV